MLMSRCSLQITLLNQSHRSECVTRVSETTMRVWKNHDNKIDVDVNDQRPLVSVERGSGRDAAGDRDSDN